MKLPAEEYASLVSQERMKWAEEEIDKAEVSRLDDRKLKAAILLADGRANYAAIARVAGVSPHTISQWAQSIAVRQAAAVLRNGLHQESLDTGYANKGKRVLVLSDMADRLLDAIRIRAANFDPELPETATGLFSIDKKTIGRGQTATVVKVAVPDVGLLKELRATFEHISREEGQWVEHSEKTLTGEIPIRFAMHALEENVDAQVTVTEIPQLALEEGDDDE